MKKTLSLLSNLLLSSTLLLGAATVGADELVLKVPAEAGAYCHMKFAPILDGTLGWQRPILDEGADKAVDFYGPCDYDPTSIDAIREHRRLLRTFGDGE
jgi:hypothetical protein